jgi:hypothetical protein
MPSQAVISDTGPTCHLCTWTVIGPGCRAKIISASCLVHCEIDRQSWDYERYRAGLPSPEPHQRTGYSQPAQFLGEIDDRRAAEKVSVSAASG